MKGVRLMMFDSATEEVGYFLLLWIKHSNTNSNLHQTNMSFVLIAKGLAI
jgi:hypothetical protein